MHLCIVTPEKIKMYGQKAFRKRQLFHAPSVSSEGESLGGRSAGGTSLTSRKSTAFSRKSAGSEIGESLRPESKWLKPREYLLLVIEAAMSLTSYVIRERNFKNLELRRVNLTMRMASIEICYAEGYSSLVSVVIGVLADSYLRYYTVALFSVILHFAAICLVFMEDTIKGNMKGNPYAQLVRNVCTWSLVLIKSSDFTRLLYGLEGMVNRRRSTVYIFVFLMFWVSSYALYGGIVMTINFLFRHTGLRLSRVAFVMNGLSLFFFVYLLNPETSRKENRGLGSRVVGCILLASFNKIFRVKKRGKKGFFGSAETKYEKTTISRTKEILLLYCLLMPCFGIVFQTMMRSHLFFATIPDRIKDDVLSQYVELFRLARLVAAVTMVVSYFGFWPLLTLIGVKNKPTIKFLIGHILLVVALFYTAALMKSLESPEFVPNTGFVRVFNTRTEPVQFIPQDRAFTTHKFMLESKEGILLAYPCTHSVLFSMMVVFNGTSTNFTMFLTVAPNEATGYMVLDPPEVVRIRGPYLPLREGPPGTNRGARAKIYFYNTAETLMEGAKVTIKGVRVKKPVSDVDLQAGVMTTIALRPGTYTFAIPVAGIEKVVDIGEGGVYGALTYATPTSREMEIDTVVTPNSASPWPYIGLHALTGFAAALGYPTLRAIIFYMAPHGLPGMAFAHLAFLEGICLWFSYIGFTTWHNYITSNVIFAYAFGVSLFFFLCVFFFLKFKDNYA